MIKTKWKPRALQAEAELTNIKKDLEKTGAELSSLRESLSAERTSWENEKNKLQEEHTEAKRLLSQQIAEQESQLVKNKETIEEKQGQINTLKLHKMASSYEEQEINYTNDVKEWKGNLVFSLLCLVVLSLVSVTLALNKPWYERFEFYLADFLLVGAVWFCGSQYSYYTKLKNDYANRKTVANTYHALLLSLDKMTPEDPEYNINKETKDKFMSKALDILCAQSIQDNKEPILTKKVLKDAAEISKLLR